jgi:hypothetical protein
MIFDPVPSPTSCSHQSLIAALTAASDSTNSSNERRPAPAGDARTNMKHNTELEPAAAQGRPNAKVMTNAMTRTSQPTQRNESSRYPRPQARNTQNDQRNYERYLALARAEAVTGDRIVAENYFQHAEHYFRSMGEKSR